MIKNKIKEKGHVSKNKMSKIQISFTGLTPNQNSGIKIRIIPRRRRHTYITTTMCKPPEGTTSLIHGAKPREFTGGPCDQAKNQNQNQRYSRRKRL